MLEITAKADLLVKKYNMLSHGDFVVVGVSGGPDSMALLCYLLSKREELDLCILVANVEHGIRGKESVADTEFVKQFCKSKDVEFATISINAVDEAKQNSLGVEEYSRIKRYEFFDKINDNVDVFDLLSNVAFDKEVVPKEERVEKVKESEEINQYNESQKNVIDEILNVYQNKGVLELENIRLLEVKNFNKFGGLVPIVNLFGGKEKYLNMINNVKRLLYS